MDISGGGPDAQDGNPEYPVPTFESLQRAYQETVTVANVAAELATENVEKVKSIANLVDERRLLQERVESLEEELVRVRSERNHLRSVLRDTESNGSFGPMISFGHRPKPGIPRTVAWKDKEDGDGKREAQDPLQQFEKGHNLHERANPYERIRVPPFETPRARPDLKARHTTAELLGERQGD
ncbi:uncharacterized protein FSUBG_12341 [Fusarium subglutinans]|uniref:Uncharacterized protein n=1 Tax=Gibberella subglutinans TaxID=42677 RepID=A0A8H5L6Q2_GIBSU|nr:uncharacterized protein FSUBG_12341 [Fusarium subglutinans]KAF5585752.1 hypothetical protein FSUBG_12341 [Fusarium subglutinans]